MLTCCVLPVCFHVLARLLYIPLSPVAKISTLVQAVAHLQLHHHVVEFVVPPAADELTDMVFT